MPKFCCFLCPKKDYSERTLEDICPNCGNTYGLPRERLPSKIRDFEIVEYVNRGFYGAAYRGIRGSLGRQVVLKVTPVGIYDFFGKDWDGECKAHTRLNETTDAFARIEDQFTEMVDFGGLEIECHVAVLEDVQGPLLEDVLGGSGGQPVALQSRTAAQIALDLYDILESLARAEQFHNDLHAGNIIVRQLPEARHRSTAYDPTIRAVAIDLGSLADVSQSHPERLGDHHHISGHMARLAAAVHKGAKPDRDEDYRIAFALRSLAEHLAPGADAQRAMTTADVARALREHMEAIYEPWKTPLNLARYAEAYNAQSLEPWHVPALWFDPEGRWLAETTERGPQVITGMRGCGKTMLLRALQFHARVAPVGVDEDATAKGLKNFRNDKFIGFYVSCNRLLDPLDRSGDDVASPFERLYVAYLRDAVQVLRRLRQIDETAIVGRIDDLLEPALQPLDLSVATQPRSGEHAFEQFLIDLQLRLANSEEICRLRVAPVEAFTYLAKVLQGASPLLAGKYVLFLLDDASTRYLSESMNRRIISQLIFQDPQCGFRITTEAQTTQRVLQSPGQLEAADPMRDYTEFDLGAEVYNLLQEGSIGKRMDFVSTILRKRGEHCNVPLYRMEPKEVLGDVALEDIALEIAKSSENAADRKKAYRGLRALQAVCVGDLGEVVKIYEKILAHANHYDLPVPAAKQSECFLSQSSHLVYALKRRKQEHRDLALAFAQASGQLLRESASKPTKSGKPRLRQYTKLYVRVEPDGDQGEVTAKLLKLMDAGVFVFDGGAPRTKTRDDNSSLQFILSFRKILGLASFIGLSDRDRFELSGDALKEWLDNPAHAKEILLRNLSNSEFDEPSAVESPTNPGYPPATAISTIAPENDSPKMVAKKPLQARLPEAETQNTPSLAAPRLGIAHEKISLENIAEEDIDLFVLARGFEERTLTSAQRILDVVKPKRVLVVEYADPQGSEILDLLHKSSIPWDVVTNPGDLKSHFSKGGRYLIDTSGLSKPYLFNSVHAALQASGATIVVHTNATNYYPADSELEALGIRANEPVDAAIVDKIGSELIGEKNPYYLDAVQHFETLPDRWRSLLASASAKNDRLLHLLDERSYDATRILAPPSTSPRKALARFAAELAGSAAEANVKIVDVDTNDIGGALTELERAYSELYFAGGTNVEIGLTGSKIHTVACAAIAAAAPISHVWYVRPEEFDHRRYSKGVADTEVFRLTLDI